MCQVESWRTFYIDLLDLKAINHESDDEVDREVVVISEVGL